MHYMFSRRYMVINATHQVAREKILAVDVRKWPKAIDVNLLEKLDMYCNSFGRKCISSSLSIG